MEGEVASVNGVRRQMAVKGEEFCLVVGTDRPHSERPGGAKYHVVFQLGRVSSDVAAGHARGARLARRTCRRGRHSLTPVQRGVTERGPSDARPRPAERGGTSGHVVGLAPSLHGSTLVATSALSSWSYCAPLSPTTTRGKCNFLLFCAPVLRSPIVEGPPGE